MKPSAGAETPAPIASRVDPLYLPILPVMVELLDAGCNLTAIGRHLDSTKAEKRRKGRWTQVFIKKLLEDHLGKEECAARLARALEQSRARRVEAHREYHATLAPRLVELVVAGLTRKEMIAKLDADGEKTALGNPWYGELIEEVLRDALGDDYDRRRAEGRRNRAQAALLRDGRSKHERTRAFYAGAAKRAVELLEKDIAMPGVALELEAEGYKTYSGRPWNRQIVQWMVSQFADPEVTRPLIQKVRSRGTRERAKAAAKHYERFRARFRRLRAEGLSYDAIAERWDGEGEKPFHGGRWTGDHVQRVRDLYGWDKTKGRPAVVLPSEPGRHPTVHNKTAPRLKPNQLKVLETIRDHQAPHKLTRGALRTLSGFQDAEGILDRLIEKAPIWGPAIGKPDGKLGFRFLPPAK